MRTGGGLELASEPRRTMTTRRPSLMPCAISAALLAALSGCGSCVEDEESRRAGSAAEGVSRGGYHLRWEGGEGRRSIRKLRDAG